MTQAPVALITGAAKRVGRAIALKLADAGFDIAFTYNTSQAQADELVSLIRKSSRRALAIKADLLNPAAPEQIFAAFSTPFTRLDALVNNASLYQPSSLQSATPEQIRNLFTIHFEA